VFSIQGKFGDVNREKDSGMISHREHRATEGFGRIDAGKMRGWDGEMALDASS
jgi:hypothetical protein